MAERPVHLVSDEVHLRGDPGQIGAELVAQELQVALDHRHGVVDLVGDPRGEFPQGGQLLRGEELAARVVELAHHLLEAPVLVPELRGAGLHLGFQRLGRLADHGVALLELIQRVVELAR